MDNSFTYHDPINPTRKARTDDNTWEKVQAAYKNKDYNGVLHGILDFVDLDLAARTGNADRSHFVIPHGSVTLQVLISDKHLEVQAPFLDISESKRIPLMRKVTEMNFSPLNLSSIILEGDLLSFRYHCPLSLCEPYRTYDALREICVYADSYDDEFISKFGARRIREPVIEPYPEKMRQEAWDHLQLYVKEAQEGINYFETKRAFNLAWDVLLITLMKLEFHLQPQGNFRTDLEKTISYLTGSEDPMNDKVSRGKKFLKELEAITVDEMGKDLYTIQTFIPYKVRSNEQAVKSNSENAFAQSKQEFEQGNHLGASLTLLYYFFNMFYHNIVPDHVYEIVGKALKETSGKPWNEVSPILYGAMQQIMASDVAKNGNGKRGGFFHKLFGKQKA